jgi:CBS domain-containing protein
MRVADRMTAKPVTISPEETLATARELMKRGRFRSLPVVEGGRLVDILTDRDTRQTRGLFRIDQSYGRDEAGPNDCSAGIVGLGCGGPAHSA